MDTETDITPDGEGKRPVSEGYSSLYEGSDYGYTWFEDVFDPVNISNGSMGGDVVSGGYIDPTSRGENMMESGGNNHIRDRTIINHLIVYGLFRVFVCDYDKEHTAGVTGQQRLRNPPTPNEMEVRVG
uniref:Uncharacterized protein n=1 Tax=Magallana gigas TaxID=29159 RepID=K1PP85_MAGGI